MINKSKLALIATLVAMSVASPAFAQSFSKGDGTANNLPFAYGPNAPSPLGPSPLPSRRGKTGGLHDFGECRHSDEAIHVRTSIHHDAQRGPNTDPGLPGDTGVSGDCGTVYGIDELKCG